MKSYNYSSFVQYFCRSPLCSLTFYKNYEEVIVVENRLHLKTALSYGITHSIDEVRNNNYVGAAT